jgi:hypothetical protein
MFRFTIRDVLLITAVVGLSLGWWMDHLNQHHQNKVLAKWQLAFESLARHLNNLDGYKITLSLNDNTVHIVHPDGTQSDEMWQISN